MADWVGIPVRCLPLAACSATALDGAPRGRLRPRHDADRHGARVRRRAARARAELGVDFPVAEMTARLGPPLDHLLAPHLPAERSRPPATASARSTPTTRSPRCRRWPGAHEALAAVRRHARPGRGRHRQVPRQRPAARRPPRPGRRPARGLGLGRRQGRRADAARAPRSTSATTSTTSRARSPPARSASRCSPAAAPARSCWTPAPTWSSTTSPSSRPGWTTTCSTPGSPPSRPTCAAAGPCWSPTAAAPTAPSCWRRRSGRSGRRTWSPPPATPTRCPRPSATPPARSRSRWASRCSRPQTHEMEREGYRANAGDRCFFCKAELLDVLTPLAAEPRHRPRRDRHQRRRRGRRLPARASAPPPSGARSPRCATPGSPRRRSGRPRGAGTCPPGTSRPRPACRRGWPTASR